MEHPDSAITDSLQPNLNDIIEAVADPIFVKDSMHRWVLLNEAFCDFMGRSREELLGRSDYEFFCKEEADIFWKKDNEVFRSGVTVENEERLTRADGTTYIISTKKSPFTSSRGEQFLVGVIRDLTHLKTTENELRDARDVAQKANEAKSRFLANASHELRTPLNGIVGIVELLRDRPWDGELKELLEILQDSSENLLALVNDLLDFSAVDSGRVSLNPDFFKPHALLKTISALFEHQAKKKEVDLRFDVEEGLPPVLHGDQNRLRQVLVNLISNAIKFTPEQGHVVVQVTTGDPEGTRIPVRFQVSDSGIGIPPDKLELVLAPFAKARQEDPGTGLGLSICHQLARLMQGRLSISNRPEGGGCEVVLELPLEFGRKPAPQPETATDHRPTFPGLRVLVVEDDQVSQKVARLTLERFECEVTLANDGLHAVELVRDQDFDLILMDCRMPNMDGYLTTKEIRKTEPPGQRIPIIALTAHAYDEDKAKCLNAGMDFWLTKPLRRKSLAAAIGLFT